MTTKQESCTYFPKSLQNSLYVGSTKDQMNEQHPDLVLSLLGSWRMLNKHLLNEFSDLKMEVLSPSWYLIIEISNNSR
jgi:hypothetical protein